MSEKKVTKSFATTQAIADHIDKLAAERAVSSSAIINMALFDYFQYIEAKKRAQDATNQ